MSYDRAAISMHDPIEPGSQRVSSVTVYGKGFQMQDTSSKMRAGFTSAELTRWRADTALVCKIDLGHGIRAHDHVVLTVGERQSTVTNFYLFQAPVLSSILNSNVAMHSTPSITVYGWNYGQFSTSSTIRIGGTACVNTRWISDSSMSCKPANGYFVPKAYLPIIMTVASAVQRQLCQRNPNPPAPCDSWSCAATSTQASHVIETPLCQDPVYTVTQAFSYDKYILYKG